MFLNSRAPVQSLYVDGALLDFWNSDQAASTAFPKFRHCSWAAAQCADFKLMLLNLLYKFDAADRDCPSVEPFEAKHRSHPLLDSPMILLDNVV
jgi:hypothetical protein